MMILKIKQSQKIKEICKLKGTNGNILTDREWQNNFAEIFIRVKDHKTKKAINQGLEEIFSIAIDRVR